MKQWSIAHLDKLKAEGKIRGYSIQSREKETKKSKYRNTKTMIDGIRFDSVKEANRYKVLRMLLKAGEIGMLEMQVEYKFDIKGEKIASYFADFRYVDSKTGEVIVEDVKSEITRKLPVYRLKKRMMKAQYGVTIKET